MKKIFFIFAILGGLLLFYKFQCSNSSEPEIQSPHSNDVDSTPNENPETLPNSGASPYFPHQKTADPHSSENSENTKSTGKREAEPVNAVPSEESLKKEPPSHISTKNLKKSSGNHKNATHHKPSQKKAPSTPEGTSHRNKKNAGSNGSNSKHHANGKATGDNERTSYTSLGEEMADSDLPFDEAQTSETEVKSSKQETLDPAVSLTSDINPVAQSLNQLIKGSNEITPEFQEEESREIIGVWHGQIETPQGTLALYLNRRWDQMTDSYLPSSCIGFKIDKSHSISGYLREGSLLFFEKKSKPRSHLIAQIGKNYVMDLTSPRSGGAAVTGRLYKRTGDQLSSFGSVKITRRPQATAEFDCQFGN